MSYAYKKSKFLGLQIIVDCFSQPVLTGQEGQ